jgi:hypothetical protein
MVPLILYIPLLAILAALFGVSLRTTVRGWRTEGRPPRAARWAAIFALIIAGSLWLMFGTDDPRGPWGAVAMAGVILVPVVVPVALLAVGVVLSLFRGGPTGRR